MTDENGDPQQADAEERPVVVAIGASAGGIQALQALFAAMPERPGAAFVVVVHLDPDRQSELPSIIAARTAMRVVQVGKAAELAANNVFVIAPGHSLQIVDHRIAALPLEHPRKHGSPIDHFFRSVAQQLGDGLAVILSGAGSDGALGVRAIKESGGIILVQDPAEAEYSSMPRSAIATGAVDFVLPTHQLAAQLVDLVSIKKRAPHAPAGRFDEEQLRRVLAHVRIRTGHDFSGYKRSTICRRICRRMQVTRTQDLNEYCNFLRDNPDEANALLADMLISVTSFFRDPDAFKALAEKVLPQLFRSKELHEPIRVWICGCATGEEAYAVAMLMLEEASRHEIRPPIQIFGSDLDPAAIAVAREGRYPSAIETDVGQEFLERYFVRDADQFRVRQEVRDLMLFAVHDLLKDPPFSHLDLVSCRNVLIYLDQELQEAVRNTFHYALNPSGYLFLGPSESADQPSGLFRTFDRGARIYQSLAEGEKRRILPRLLGEPRLRDHFSFEAPSRRALPPNEAAVHRKVIEQVAPPSILVDEGHRVLHLSDNAGRFIWPSGGPLTGDVGDLVRPELRFELRSALHRIFDQNQPSLSLPILVKFDGVSRRVHLLVKGAQESEPVRHAVVMFVEGEAVEGAPLPADQHVADETVRRLAQELEMTQVRLKTVREESDSRMEELRAANEELRSINEEYRSTSEELETSREELQSVNEELQTVNMELKLKLEAISRAHGDLQNLMAAADFGTLFLDARLRIKRFTDQVQDLFSITANDMDRPITDFAHQLEYGDLVADAQSVLAQLIPVRRSVRSRSGRWYDLRMRPYRTLDDKIDGVVITFVDVTDRQHTEEALRERERQLSQQKRMVELSREPIAVWEFSGEIVDWNRGCEELYGFTREEALGKQKEALLHTSVPGGSGAELRNKLLAEGSWSGELEQRAKNGRKVLVETRLELEELEGRRLVLDTSRDITEHKQLQRRQELLLSELTHRVKNLLAIAQSMAVQTLRTSGSPEEFVERFEGRLTSMSRAHDLLVQAQWEGADVAEMLDLQIDAVVPGHRDRIRVHGPRVSLPARMATPFGLVLHELATNAAKHGSLAGPNGSLSVEWKLKTDNRQRLLVLLWRESGGEAVHEPAHAGYGSCLIEKGIPGAVVSREFGPSGFSCTMEIPLEPQEKR